MAKMENRSVYGRNIDVRLVSNEKDYLKWISKPSYVLQKILTI